MPKAKRFPFSPQENNYIVQLVKQLGEDWNAISQKLPGRSPKQIKDRYMNYLREGLTKDPWTEQEEQVIISKYHSFGPLWSKMMIYLPGRSANDIKNRWYKHILKRNKKFGQKNNSFVQMNNDSPNIIFNNNLKFEQNSKFVIKMIPINKNISNRTIINQQNNMFPAIFPNSNILVEPMINKPEKQEIKLQKQNQYDNFIAENNFIFDDLSVNSDLFGQNQDFEKLFENEEMFNEKQENNALFESDPIFDFNSTLQGADSDFLIENMLETIDFDFL